MQNHINRRKLYKAKQKMQYKITTCTVYTTLRHWRKVFESPCYNNFYYPFYIICVQPIWGIPPQVVTLLVFNHLRHFSSSCNIICPQPLWGIFPQVLTLFVLNLFEVFLLKLCSTSLRYFSPSCNIFFAQPLWGISPQVVTLFVLNLFEVFLLELLHYFCGPAQLSLAHTAQLHIYCFLKLLQKQVALCTWSFLSDPSPIIVCSCLSSFRQDVVNFSILVFHSLISPLHWGCTIMLS